MGKVTLVFLAFVLACTSAGNAHADKDSTCETYALSAMRQIKETAKHEECLERGFFSGDRWREDFNFHYNACAQRYDAATKGHLAFTRGEKEARDGQLSACIDKEARGNAKDHGIEDHPCFSYCSSTKCGGATKEVRDACVLGCLASTNCTPH